MRAYEPMSSHLRDDVVTSAIGIFTRKLPNGDGTRSSVLDDWLRYLSEDRAHRHPGGKPTCETSIVYSVLAILVAIYVLILERRRITWGGVTDLLLHRLDPAQRQQLGMTADLTGTRAEADLLGRTSKDPQVQRDGLAAHKAEADRVSKFGREIMDVIDPSPFYKRDTLTKKERTRAKRAQADDAKKGRPSSRERAAGTSVNGQHRRVGTKMNNKLRREILQDENHPDRRIHDATIKRNTNRLLDVMNKIVAAAAPENFPHYYMHDLAVDETIAITMKPRFGHGNDETYCISSDPDAQYWKGKKDEDEERGFGYGFEILWRAGRPYSREVPKIPLGISIGRITGGSVSLVSEIHERAERFGLITPDITQRGYLIADMGYTIKDSYVPFLLREGYSSVHDIPSTWLLDVTLADTNARGDSVDGAHIHSGAICCPGISGIEPLTPGARDKSTETAEEIRERAHHEQVIQLHVMPIQNGLRPHGRKNHEALRDGDFPDTYKITVQCPAAAGKVECAAYRLQHGGRRDPRKPEITYSGVMNEVADLPSVCRQRFSTITIGASAAKKLQPLLHRTYLWEDYFRTVRSANERGNNMLTNPFITGASGEWTQQRGVAKQGLFWAIALAQTSLRIQRSFPLHYTNADGTPRFSPREALRRTRQAILKPRIGRKRNI